MPKKNNYAHSHQIQSKRNAYKKHHRDDQKQQQKLESSEAKSTYVPDTKSTIRTNPGLKLKADHMVIGFLIASIFSYTDAFKLPETPSTSTKGTNPSQRNPERDKVSDGKHTDLVASQTIQNQQPANPADLNSFYLAASALINEEKNQGSELSKNDYLIVSQLDFNEVIVESNVANIEDQVNIRKQIDFDYFIYDNAHKLNDKYKDNPKELRRYLDNEYSAFNTWRTFLENKFQETIQQNQITDNEMLNYLQRRTNNKIEYHYARMINNIREEIWTEAKKVTIDHNTKIIAEIDSDPKESNSSNFVFIDLSYIGFTIFLASIATGIKYCSARNGSEQEKNKQTIVSKKVKRKQNKKIKGDSKNGQESKRNRETERQLKQLEIEKELLEKNKKRELRNRLDKLNENLNSILCDGLIEEQDKSKKNAATKLREQAKSRILNTEIKDKNIRRKINNLKSTLDNDPASPKISESKIEKIKESIKSCEKSLTDELLIVAELLLKEYQESLEKRDMLIRKRMDELDTALIKSKNNKLDLALDSITSNHPSKDNEKEKGNKEVENNEEKEKEKEEENKEDNEKEEKEKEERSEGENEWREKELLDEENSESNRENESHNEKLHQLLMERGIPYEKRSRHSMNIVSTNSSALFTMSGPKPKTIKTTLRNTIIDLFILISKHLDEFIKTDNDDLLSIEEKIGRPLFLYFIEKMCEFCNRKMKDTMPTMAISRLRNIICHQESLLADNKSIYKFVVLFKQEFELEYKKQNTGRYAPNSLFVCTQALLTTIEKSDHIKDIINAYTKSHQPTEISVSDFVMPKLNLVKDVQLFSSLYVEKVMPLIVEFSSFDVALRHLYQKQPEIYHACEFILTCMKANLEKCNDIQIEDTYLYSLRNCIDHELGALDTKPMEFFFRDTFPKLVRSLDKQGLQTINQSDIELLATILNDSEERVNYRQHF